MIIGETKLAREIDRGGSGRYIWVGCADCGKERWVLTDKNGQPRNGRCGSCACKITAPLKVKRGREHPNWKGGRYLSVTGYVEVRVDKTSPFHIMARSGDRVYEHRFVMAQSLGRCLETNEVVHHLNGIKTDNREDNLCLVDSHSHSKGTLRKALQKRIRELERKTEKETD